MYATSTTYLDREREQIKADMAAHKARVAAERVRLYQSLDASIDPAIFAAAAQAQAALDEALTAVESARQRLEKHTASKPELLGNVGQWAKTKGQLTDELEGYQSVAEHRRHALAQADQAVYEARYMMWQAEVSVIQQQQKITKEHGAEAIEAARLALQETEKRVNDENGRIWQKLEFIRANPPEKPGA